MNKLFLWSSIFFALLLISLPSAALAKEDVLLLNPSGTLFLHPSGNMYSVTQMPITSPNVESYTGHNHYYISLKKYDSNLNRLSDGDKTLEVDMNYDEYWYRDDLVPLGFSSDGLLWFSYKKRKSINGNVNDGGLRLLSIDINNHIFQPLSMIPIGESRNNYYYDRMGGSGNSVILPQFDSVGERAVMIGDYAYVSYYKARITSGETNYFLRKINLINKSTTDLSNYDSNRGLANGIDVDSSGNIYVTRAIGLGQYNNNFTIEKLDSSGKLLYTIAHIQPSTNPNNPKYKYSTFNIRVTPDGSKLYIPSMLSGSTTSSLISIDNVSPVIQYSLPASCSSFVTSATIGSSVAWKATPYGGVAPYRYYFSDVSGVVTDNTTGIITRSYITTGLKYMNMAIIDAANTNTGWFSCTGNVNVTTQQAVTPTTITTWTGPSSVRAGTSLPYSINFNASKTSIAQQIFVQFEDSSGTIQMINNASPTPDTTLWSGTVSTPITVSVPSTAPAGTYKVMAGLQDPMTGSRLPLTAGAGVTENGDGRYQVGTITVNTPTTALTLSCTPSVTSATTGTTVTWNATATGGKAPYRYYWSDVSGVVTDNTTGSVTRAYTTTGSKSMGIAVIDGANTNTGWAFCTGNVSVTAQQAVTPTTITTWTGPSSVRAGTSLPYSINFNASKTSIAQQIFVQFEDSSGTIQMINNASPTPDTTLWSGTVSTPITVSVPSTAPAGTYKVMAGLQDPMTGSRLPLTAGAGVTSEAGTRYQVGTIIINASTSPTITTWTGPSSVTSGTSLSYSINFNTVKTATDQTILVHFVDSTGTNRFVSSVSPSTRTTQWTGTVSTPITVAVPAGIPTGTYKVMAGLYTTASGRLPLTAGSGVTVDSQTRYQVGTITVNAPTTALSLSCAPSVTSATTGTTVTWNATATGGIRPYKYYFSDVANQITDNTTGSITRAYTTTGQKYMSIAVIDAANTKVDWAFCTGNVNVTTPTVTPPPVTPPTTPPVTYCEISAPSCPKYPTYQGTTRDTYLGSDKDQTKCLARASAFVPWCGAKLPVTARYYSDGAKVGEQVAQPVSTTTGYIQRTSLMSSVWGAFMNLLGN